MRWDVEKGTVDHTILFESAVLFAQLHPRNECGQPLGGVP